MRLRLRQHILSGVTTTYTYDGNGYRATKKVGTAAAKRFVWDPENAVEMLLTDGNHKFLWAPDGTLLTQQRISDGAQTYPISDIVRTVHGVTNQNGSIAGTATYDPFGKRTSTAGTMDGAIGFAGEYRDDESGLIHLRARQYDPTTGIFLSRDPLLALTRDPYGYASGNPNLLTDPTGQCPMCATALIGGAIGAVFGGAVAAATHLATGGKPDDLLGAVVGGAVSGGITGLCTGFAGPAGAMACNVVLGGVGGAVGSVVTDKVNGNPISGGRAVAGGLIGGAFGAGSGVAQMVLPSAPATGLFSGLANATIKPGPVRKLAVINTGITGMAGLNAAAANDCFNL